MAAVGSKAALEGPSLGLIDNWLRHIQDVRDRHAELLTALPDSDTRWRALCELNVIEQCATSPAPPWWAMPGGRGQSLMLHGWIYGLMDGRLQDLRVSIRDDAELDDAVALAIAGVRSRYVAAVRLFIRVDSPRCISLTGARNRRD